MIKIYCPKLYFGQVVVMHTYNPSTQEVETDRFLGAQV